GAGFHSPEACAAHRVREKDHAAPPAGRRTDLFALEILSTRVAHNPPPSRKDGRYGLSRQAEGRSDPADRPDSANRGCIRRAHYFASLQVAFDRLIEKDVQKFISLVKAAATGGN